MASRTRAPGWDVPGSLLETDTCASVTKNAERVRHPNVAVEADRLRAFLGTSEPAMGRGIRSLMLKPLSSAWPIHSQNCPRKVGVT
jgi:hypothetical protein